MTLIDKFGEDFQASEDVNNEMEIDDGEVLSKSPKVLKALITALFQVISSPAGLRSARTGLKTCMILVSKAASSDKQDVRFVLYEGIAKYCQSQVQQQDQSESRDRQFSETARAFVLSFVEGPSSLHDAENEATRRKRAEALDAYISVASQPDQHILEWTNAWVKSERSRTVREVLDKACKKIR